MNDDVIVLNPLLHYKKPEIGGGNQSTNQKSVTPLQIAFPTGGYGIGVSVARADENPQQDRQAAVIMSSPGDDDDYKSDLRTIKFAFLVFAILNIIITSCMYFNATIAVPESVSSYTDASISVSVFQKPSTDRPHIQNLNYGFFIAILIMGCFSVLFESSIGISMYVVSVALNFLLSMSIIPYFLYSFRYLLDMVLFYLALVFRSKITYTYLPRRIFDIRDRIRANI
jgi:hypothetical protein